MLAPKDVERRVVAMHELVGSQEWIGAACYERALWLEVLTAIADGQWGAEQLAQEAVRTVQYEFPRFARRATPLADKYWKQD